MDEKAFQDCYEDAHSICFGCGRLNPKGLQIKSYWDGDESVCRFVPQPHQTAMAGYVYGGIIASVIDCHGTGTAAAAAYRAAGRDMGTEPHLRYVTASLHVDYLRPTPSTRPWSFAARSEMRDAGSSSTSPCLRKVNLATGEVIAVQIPEYLR